MMSSEMASTAIGVRLSMISGRGGGGDDVTRATLTTLKLNQKKSRSESGHRFLGMNKFRSSGEIRSVSKAVGEEEKQTQEVSRNLRVGLICGGPSAERGISLNSARSVLDHIQVFLLLPF